MGSPSDICAACGADHLVPHLSVAGSIGEKGLIPTTDQFGTALADIVRCPSCTHMQLSEFPPTAVLAEAYEEAESAAYVDEEEGQRATARVVLDEIGSWAPAGSLLDLGCWVGFFLAEANMAGWQTLGVEPSRFASDYARQKLDLNVVTGEIGDVSLENGAFDAVYMGDVIEHLPDAPEALDRVAGLLRPRGVLALALPDAGSRLAQAMGSRWWSVLPTHVHYFTRRSLGTMLARHGFEPLSFSTSPKAFTVRYYLDRVSGYSPALASRMVGVASALGVADHIWAPDFGDRMLVVARAPGREFYDAA